MTAGASVAGSVAEAVQDARVVIAMPPTAEIVSAARSDEGVSGAFAPGAVLAQTGTIGEDISAALLTLGDP